MSLRPTNPSKITYDDLLPGDVILSGGPESDLLDLFIYLVDQGDYTHATQYIGKKDGVHMVVEATINGILFQSIEDDMTQVLVDVYRYVSPDRHQIGDKGWPVEPIIDKALSYKGAKYAYSKLLLVGLALIACEIPKKDKIGEMVLLLSRILVSQLVGWLERNADKTPMTCVQVVTSSHWQAESTPTNKYGLKVIVDGSRENKLFSSAELSESPDYRNELAKYHKLRNEFIEKLTSENPSYKKVMEQKSKSMNLLLKSKSSKMEKSKSIFIAGSDLLPLGSCTPRDMQTSPSLELVGCLKDER